MSQDATVCTTTTTTLNGSGDKLPIDSHFSTLPPENDDEGNSEYKWMLPAAPSSAKMERLVSQLIWRIDEGLGEAIYQLGVDDDGTPRGVPAEVLATSLSTLRRMAARVNAEATVLVERDGDDGRCAEVLVRRVPGDAHGYVDVRVVISGNVDAGKSTLIGCLTHAQLDDGRGKARASIFNHPHEVKTGRTSSVAHHLLGFDACGRRVNTPEEQTWGDVIGASSKLLTLTDLAGHERYLKTTVRGISGQLPDYAILVVGGNMGITNMTREHMKLCLSLRIPIVAVVTKIDMAPKHVLKATISGLKHEFKARGIRRLTLKVDSDSDVVEAAQLVGEETSRVVPLFLLSAVTGAGLNRFVSFLNLLTPRIDWSSKKDHPGEVEIDDIYWVKGVGTVVGGTVVGGTIHQNNENMLLGPTSTGEFLPVSIRSIHSKRIPVLSVSVGRSAGFALRKVKRDQVRRGMVLVDASAKPQAYWEFEADVAVLYHSTTITNGYAPVVQCVNVRQCARLLSMRALNKDGSASDAVVDVMRTNSKARCRFRFLYRPERVRRGSRLLITEGKTKAIGVVRAVVEDEACTVPAGRRSRVRAPGAGGRRARRRRAMLAQQEN